MPNRHQQIQKTHSGPVRGNLYLCAKKLCGDDRWSNEDWDWAFARTGTSKPESVDDRSAMIGV